MAKENHNLLNRILPDMDLSWISDKQNIIYSLTAKLLGTVYYQVDWQKMRTSKIATDIFEHRIKNSSRKPNIPRFLNKLCNQLSIQALHEEPELILSCEQFSDQILKTIRTESQLCVMLARRYAQFKKQTKTKTKKGELI